MAPLVTRRNRLMSNRSDFILAMMAGGVWFAAYYLGKVAEKLDAVLAAMKKSN